MRIIKCSLFIIILFLNFNTQASITINGTRFVYDQYQKSINIGIRNEGNDYYLINSEIQNNNQEGIFIITPPLFSLQPNSENKIRIFYSGRKLPDDRESLFKLVITAIPSDNKKGKNQVQMAIRSHFKLFFRPRKLTADPESAYQKLIVKKQDKGIFLINPTPYYITLINLSIEDQPVEKSQLIAPLSQIELNYCQRGIKCKLTWQTFNDEGALLPKYSILIN